MKPPAPSLASSSVAPTSSRASPKRFIGVCPRIEATRSGDRILRFCSAGKKPGQKGNTRINPLMCDGCGQCPPLCKFNAILEKKR